MVAVSFDNGFQFLSFEERNSLQVYASHMPVIKIFGVALPRLCTLQALVFAWLNLMLARLIPPCQ